MSKIDDSLEVLIDITTETNDFDDLKKAIFENKDEVANALQFLGDADFESYIKVAHKTLWKVCPPELEDHVIGCCNFYTGMIAKGWDEFDEDMHKTMDKWCIDHELMEDTGINVKEAADFFAKCWEAS